MSDITSGTVVGVSAAIGMGAVAVVSAAVAVAGVGVVVAQQTGRAVLACGRELKDMAEQNRAMQRSLQQAALRYEEKMRRQEQERERMQRAELQRRLAEQREAVQRGQQRLLRMRQAQQVPPTPSFDWDKLAKLRAEILAGEPPSENTQRHQISDWEQRLKSLREMTSGLKQGIEYFVSGPGQGLFVVAGLVDVLKAVEDKLRSFEQSAVEVMLGQKTIPARELENLLVRLEYVDDRLREMRAQVPQKRSQRQTAIEALEKANQGLQKALQNPEAANYVTGAEMLSEMLDQATEHIEAARFEQARATAEAVLHHLQHIEATVSKQRRKNLTVLMEIYRSKVVPLQQIPELASRVDLWRQEFNRIAVIAEKDAEQAWQLVTQPEGGLFAVAEALQQEALALLLQHQAIALSQLSCSTLQEMGYNVVRDTADGGVRFIEAHSGNRRIYVSFSENGDMVVKTDGFGDASCRDAMQEFLKRLQAKGVQGVWQEKFLLTDALQRLVRLLQEAGFDVKVEPTDDGVTVLAHGVANANAKIDYDGRGTISQEMLDQIWRIGMYQQKTYPDINREMEDQWRAAYEDHRRHLEAMRLREQVQ